MRSSLSLLLTLALTTSSVAHAGWSRDQRATLNEIVALENADKLEEAVARAATEVARADAPSGYRRAVAKRGKAAALKFFERETDPRRVDVRRAVLCSALQMFRTYQADLIESEDDRLEIPTEVAELEAHAVAADAPCAPTRPAPATPSTPPPEPETSSSPPAPAASPTPPTEGALDIPTARLNLTRTRGQIAGGVSLLGAAAGLGAGLAACFVARGPEAARIAALDRRATEAGRDLTDDERAQADAADARYVRLSNGGKALGVFAGMSLIAAMVVLAMPPKNNTARIRARAVGGGIRIEF